MPHVQRRSVPWSAAWLLGPMTLVALSAACASHDRSDSAPLRRSLCKARARIFATASRMPAKRSPSSEGTRAQRTSSVQAL